MAIAESPKQVSAQNSAGRAPLKKFRGVYLGMPERGLKG